MTGETRTAVRPARMVLAAALAGGVVGVVLTVEAGATLGRGDRSTVERATVDSVEDGTGVVCLRRDDGDVVDCHPSAVPGLRAGDLVDYVLTPAAVDASQPGSGTVDVITWARRRAGAGRR
ncbi:hypothetical protein [Arthrobacter sp. NEB 688]|uniref:hypothetical protein n=1 Tax=Arthrobacter sp. NEB 688 TaxID=904039 RepID=UPI001565950F|nr:hypothetical protein [Arthrobacter sp. NEB 688]QKE84300.1 hypothetical protein HL663_10365 [Arthrobacter sp. NEB 688]